MKIGIAGPIAIESVASFLQGDIKGLPIGYPGAPLLGTLIGALLDRGHTVTAYSTSSDLPTNTSVSASHGRFKITLCAARLRAFRYSNGHLGRAADAFKLERNALRQVIQNDAPDVIHAHWSYEFALAAIASGLPHVVTCHDAPQVVLKYSPDPYRLVRYFMARRVLNKARVLTAVSPYLKQKINCYARAPIIVVPNPVPMLPDRDTERVRTYNPEFPRIVMVLNGWGVRKNPKPALRAFAILRRQFPTAELMIMGNDFGVGQKAEIWAKSQNLVDGVHFMGTQPYSVLLSKLAESDLLLHPALEETFGMSIVEAMAQGVPVVGGRVSGAVPWIIGDGGAITDVTSASAIAATIAVLLSDSALYFACGQRARVRVSEQFSADQVAAAYEQIYSQVLDAVESHRA